MSNLTQLTLNYDIRQIRDHAKNSVQEGAVTKDYPLEIEKACQLLNEALATEILCVLRYRRHQIMAKGIDFIQVSDEFKEHAEQEENHMLMIAERINQLGGDPDFNPDTLSQRSLTEYGKAVSLNEMIRENLIAERIVISVYRKMIEWFQEDPTTRIMLESILKDEEEHADELANLLSSN